MLFLRFSFSSSFTHSSVPFFPQLHARQSSAKRSHSSILVFFLSPAARPCLGIITAHPHNSLSQKFHLFIRVSFSRPAHLTLRHTLPLSFQACLPPRTTLLSFIIFLLNCLVSSLFQPIYVSLWLVCLYFRYPFLTFVSSLKASVLDHYYWYHVI